MGFSKPTVQLDWILDNDPIKYTVPSGPDQLAGFISGTNADPKIFNWSLWRISQWIEFLDNSFDSNGNEVNAPKSTTITETIAPTASCITLDAGGIKSWDGSSNTIFSVTEAGAVSLGYSGSDIISLTAGVMSVCTATSADLVKLHAITASAADLNNLTGSIGNGLVVADITKLAAITASAADVNTLAGAVGNGLVVADITKLAAITASAANINQLTGNTFGGSSAGDVVTINGSQTLTNKSITFSQITSGNVASGVDCGFTGDNSDPATLRFGDMAGYYVQISNNTNGTLFTVAPSSHNQVDYRLSVSGSSLFKNITEDAVANVELTAGTEIKLIAPTTSVSSILKLAGNNTKASAARVNLIGSTPTYSTDIYANTTGSQARISPSADASVSLLLGDSTSTRLAAIYGYVSGLVQFDAYVSANDRAMFELVGGAGTSYGRLTVEVTGTSNQYIWTEGAYYPNTPDTVDCGAVNHEWQDVYTLNAPTVGDFYHLDYRSSNGKIVKVNDLDTILSIKPSGKFDKVNGLMLIDDNTIPKWLRFKDRKTKKTVYNEQGKPYLDLKTMISLLMGGEAELKLLHDALDERLLIIEKKIGV